MFSKLVLVAALAVCGVAQAKDVFVAERGKNKLTLTDEAGSCPVGTKLARLIQEGEKSEGCWIAAHGMVFFFFEDGYGLMEEEEFQKVASL